MRHAGRSVGMFFEDPEGAVTSGRNGTHFHLGRHFQPRPTGLPAPDGSVRARRHGALIEQGEGNQGNRKVFLFALRCETRKHIETHEVRTKQREPVAACGHGQDAVRRNGQIQFGAVGQGGGAQFSVEQSEGKRVGYGQLGIASRFSPRFARHCAPTCFALRRITDESALVRGQSRHEQDVTPGEQLLRGHGNDARRVGSFDPIVEMDRFAADPDVTRDKSPRGVSALGNRLTGIVFSVPRGREPVQPDTEAVEWPLLAKHAHQFPVAVVNPETHRAAAGRGDEADLRALRRDGGLRKRGLRAQQQGDSGG